MLELNRLKVSFTPACDLLFKCASNSFRFLPAHSPDHRISVGFNGNLLIICLCWLPDTYKDYGGLEKECLLQINKHTDRFVFNCLVCWWNLLWKTCTHRHRWQPTDREEQSVTAVLVSLLASGCLTRLATVARQKPPPVSDGIWTNVLREDEEWNELWGRGERVCIQCQHQDV